MRSLSSEVRVRFVFTVNKILRGGGVAVRGVFNRLPAKMVVKMAGTFRLRHFFNGLMDLSTTKCLIINRPHFNSI